MSDAEKYFFAECAAHVRALPVAQAAVFLRGCLLSCPAAADTPLQPIHVALSQSDKQLELIATGLLKLNLTANDE